MPKHFEQAKLKSDAVPQNDGNELTETEMKNSAQQNHSQDADRHLKIRHPRSEKV